MPAQKGYAAFLTADKNMVIRKDIVNRLACKRKTILALFQTLPGFDKLGICPPQGAFYFFPNVSGYIGMRTPSGKVIEDDKALSLYLLKRANSAMLPGSYFGKPGFLRIAYAATSDSEVLAGVTAMADALALLSN